MVAIVDPDIPIAVDADVDVGAVVMQLPTLVTNVIR